MNNFLIICIFVELSSSLTGITTDDAVYRMLWRKQITMPMASGDVLTIKTNENEVYECTVPSDEITPIDHSSSHAFGLSELSLLHQLFMDSCIYRIEGYWSYELCHGRHLRQFHDDKQNGILQEYFLGYFKKSRSDILKVIEREEKRPLEGFQPPSHDIDKHSLPYYELMYEDGTVCDITGTPRITAVHYMCQPHVHEAFISIREVSSCLYEAWVLTDLLCVHSAYQPPMTPVNDIFCTPKQNTNSPVKPEALQRWESYSRQLTMRESSVRGDQLEDELKSLSEKIVSAAAAAVDAATGKGPSARSSTSLPAAPSATPAAAAASAQARPANFDQKIVLDFLRGHHCLHGGTGWWRHEFCFGGFVKQYHRDPVTQTDIMLGFWKIVNHLNWLKNSKRPGKVCSA